MGRALDIPLPEVVRIANLIPNVLNITLGKAIDTVPELQQIAEDERYERLIRIARTLEGVARNSGVHPAGVVLTEGRLTQYVPLCKSKDDLILTQYNMTVLEEIGVNKLDILGIDALPTIDRAIELIE